MLVASKIALNHQTNFIRFRSGDFQFDLEYIQLFQLVLPLFTLNMYLTAEVLVTSHLFVQSQRKRFEIFSKLTIKTQNGVNDVALVFLLLTWNIFDTFS